MDNAKLLTTKNYRVGEVTEHIAAQTKLVWVKMKALSTDYKIDMLIRDAPF